MLNYKQNNEIASLTFSIGLAFLSDFRKNVYLSNNVFVQRLARNVENSVLFLNVYWIVLF